MAEKELSQYQDIAVIGAETKLAVLEGGMNAQAPSTALGAFVDEQIDASGLPTEVDALKAGQSTNAIYADTLLDLQAVVGSYEGQGAFVLNGDDAGQYRWTGAEWAFLRADMLTQKADKQDVAEVAGRLVSTIQGAYVEIDNDPNGHVAFAVHADGTREFLRTKVGGMTVAMVDSSTAAVDGRIDWHGNYQEWAQGLAGYLANALLVEIDSVGRVGRILWADGSQWPSGTPEPTQFVLVDQTSLPNGAQGENPSGGWTCTGLDVISTGKWLGCRLVGNDGRAYEGSSGGQTAPFLCSIVCTSPDMRRILWELPCNTTAFPGIQSIQGVAWDTSDDTIWFADKTNKIIRHISLAGVKLLDEIVVSHTLNGIAYRPDLDAIYTPDEGTSTIRLVSCADDSVLRTQTGIHPQADQLHYEQGRNRLWATVGANGVDGQALVYDADTMALLETHTLKGSQSIEGIWYDPAAKALLTVNDGGFHLSANPPLALACKYNYL
ncbi:hypothetical protein A7X93_00695 [Stenotrophomonas maltophilia]|uniref:YncE family protein n=1 Tax=Stenotrophomonas maltophilia TaxID=40324 RepID=UPI000DAA867A|nr:WD40 repeat domain-containing protein [Stenotrophomonas maltophilia]PZT35156.1 hypothetical protein A7X93_00695 [Stenotrophomonas maltophilia]